MLSFFRSFLIALSILVYFSSSARAEVFNWQDPVSKLSVVVPDTWRIGHDQKSDDVMTFWAPGAGDYASCRMRVRDDARFVIYPRRYADEIARLNFSRDFWDGYIGEFASARLNQFKGDAGLGRGFGSYADVSFVTDAGPKVQKRGIVLVSTYNDRAYIFECSAEMQAFPKWHQTFLRIASSVDFRKILYELPGGNYRDFLRDEALIVYGEFGSEPGYY